MKLGYKTLGTVSAHLLTQLQKQGQTIFSISTAMKITGKDYFATGDLLSELVRRNLLARIKAGKYMILHTGAENVQLKNWPLIARELALPHPYFISYYSAMRLHGMTSHPLFDITVTAPHRLRDQRLSGFHYHFIFCKKEHFWGRENHWVTKQEKVAVSDLEKTLLDGMDRPDLCGGILEVARGLWIKKENIHYKKLLRYAKKFRTQAALKRLGYIFEILKINEDFAMKLSKHLRDSQDYVLLDPTQSKKGTYLKRWHLQLNLNPEELKESVWA